MSEKKVIFRALFDKSESMKDRGKKLRLYTRELSPEDALALEYFLHEECVVMFKSEWISNREAQELEIPKPKPKKGKSSSQKLRNVIWLYGQQQGIPEEESEQFYNQEMFHIIESYKEKLD